MGSLQRDVDELHRQLQAGAVQRGYVGLITYMARLRSRFAETYGEQAVSALYQGYLDMTYFAVFTDSLRSRGLKAAIVFNYESFRFEAWLVARNRKTQREYWERFKGADWDHYRIVEPAVGVDAIVERVLADDFDLDEPHALTPRIEHEVAAFIGDMESYLEARVSG